MAIDRVGSNPVSFGNFYANPKGSYSLASLFTKKPALVWFNRTFYLND